MFHDSITHPPERTPLLTILTAGIIGMSQTNPLQGIEYTIYTFAKTDAGDQKNNKWEKHDSQGDMQQVLVKAEELFESGDYQKVEVKQKYFDKKKNRNIDMTLRVFEFEKKREISAFMILVFAVICGAAAFGLTYFLMK